jgi:predicted DNA-binding transcriptional regulator YafY
MRADRLLALMMLLQTRGRMTARRLARELEVSERTIYRDIDALSAAGVPVYGEPGRDGGYALLDSYRTTLTGLSEGEVQALFMLSIPAPLADLGVSQELKAALLKLSAALPAARRRDQARVQQRFHLDGVGWRQGEEAVPHLTTLHRAVWDDRRLRIAFRLPPLGVTVTQEVAPYGLVAKAGVWYLVYAHKGTVRVRRVSAVLEAETLETSFVRPDDFDLPAFWQAWCARVADNQQSYRVLVRVAPDFLPVLPYYFGKGLLDTLGDAGEAILELPFESFEAARDRILSLGRGVEVLAPPALRASVLDFAQQIVALYQG